MPLLPAPRCRKFPQIIRHLNPGKSLGFGIWLAAMIAITTLLIQRSPNILLNQFSATSKKPARVLVNTTCGLGLEFEDLEFLSVELVVGHFRVCLKPEIHRGHLRLLTSMISNLSLKTPAGSEHPLDSSTPSIHPSLIFGWLRNLIHSRGHLELSNSSFEFSNNLTIQVESLELETMDNGSMKLSGVLAVNDSGPIDITTQTTLSSDLISLSTIEIHGSKIQLSLLDRFIDQRYSQYQGALISSFHLVATGQISPDKIVFKAQRVFLTTDLGQASAKADLTMIPDNFSYKIDIMTENLSRGILGVIPENVMGSETYQWLALNLHYASCSQGNIVIAGSNAEINSLSVSLNCQDVSMGIDKHWPELMAQNVTVLVTKNSLNITSPSVKLGELIATNIHVSLSDFTQRDIILGVKAKLRQPIQEIIPALSSTPFSDLARKINRLPWRASGVLLGQLSLGIPLAKSGEPNVAFVGEVIHGQLSAKSELLPETDALSAKIKLSKKVLSLTEIAGRLRWSQGLNDSVEMKLNGRGLVDLKSDDSTYNFGFEVVPGSINADSGALGQFVANVLDAGSASIDGNLRQLRASSVMNGHIHSDFQLMFDSLQWGAIISTEHPQQIEIGLVKFDIPSARGVVNLTKQDSIKAEFSQITLPDLFPSFAKKDSFKADQFISESSKPLDPRDFPGIDLTVKKLFFGWRELGETKIKIEKVIDGLQLKRFAIEQGPCSQFNTTGSWLISSNGSSVVNIFGELYCRDVGRSFRMLQAPALVQGFKGGLKYHFSWNAPSKNSLDMIKIDTTGTFANGKILMAKQGLLKAIDLLTLNFKKDASNHVQIKELKFETTKVGPISDIQRILITSPGYTLKLNGNYNFNTEIIDADVEVRVKVYEMLTKAAELAVNPLFADQILDGQIDRDFDALDNMTKYSFKLQRKLSNDGLKL